jgi:hypothetical protein
MSNNIVLIQFYFRHSWKLLLRYQQVYLYPILFPVLILLPKWLSIDEKYYVFIFLFNLIMIIWLCSPYYLSQFSFSPEDARSLSLFDTRFRDLVIIRNLVNFIMLLVLLVLNLALLLYFYPMTNQIRMGLILLSLLSFLPAISIGNFITSYSIRWNTDYNMSWKSIFVILSIFFTEIIIKISFLFFSSGAATSMIIALLFVYLTVYYFSFRRIVKTISTYFSSIAEIT